MRSLRPVMIGLALLSCTVPAAEVRTATEQQVRAVFLFQLAQYTTWPAGVFADTSTPWHFCVLGQDDLVGMLESTVKDKTIEGRQIVISAARDLEQIAGCHVAFIGFARRKQIEDAFARWSYPPVLLVGEAPGFAQSGGMVNLVIRSGRVSFEINLANAERARIGFRSQLLRFAERVGGTPKETR